MNFTKEPIRKPNNTHHMCSYHLSTAFNNTSPGFDNNFSFQPYSFFQIRSLIFEKTTFFD